MYFALSFAAAVNYGVGTLPSAVTVADFNTDGRLDLAVAAVSSGNVSVLMGRGDGTFVSAVAFTAGPATSSVVAGDFNGDSRPDLATTNPFGDSVSILLGRGDGSFMPAVSYTIYDNPQAVAVGDFDADGRQDLAVASINSHDVTILRGVGDGSFDLGLRYSVGTWPQSVVAADFNGDGKVDLVTGNNAAPNLRISTLLGQGDGTFADGALRSAGATPHVHVGDVNADGRPDLVTANWNDSAVGILLGQGNGTFADPISYPAGAQTSGVAIDDFDRDGHADLAVASHDVGSEFVTLFLGLGDGTFVSAPGHYTANRSPQAIAAGDLNGDGRPDLVVANGNSDDVSVLLNTTDVGPNTAPTAITLGQDLVAIRAAAGTLVGAFTTSDPDSGDTHTYSLVDSAGGRFKISGANLVVANSTLLDPSLDPTLSITVRSTDAGGLSVVQSFPIRFDRTGLTADQVWEVLARETSYQDWTAGQAISGIGPTTFTVERVFNDIATGFYAIGLRSAAGDPTLVIRGTEPAKAPTDVLADVSPEGVGYPQFQANRTIVLGWLSAAVAAGRPADLVGHSLGGSLTQLFAAAFTQQGGRLDQIVTFNSPGISEDWVGRFQTTRAASVSHFLVSGDVVQLAGEEYLPGRATLYTYAGWNPLDKHLLPILAPYIDANGEASAVRSRPASVAARDLSVNWLNSPFFTYTAQDYWKLIGATYTAVTLTAQLPGLSRILYLRDVLLMRGTVETARANLATDFPIVYETIVHTPQFASGLLWQLPSYGTFGLSGLEDVPMVPQNLRLSYQDSPFALRIHGTLALPKLFGVSVTADLSAPDNYLQIADDGLQVRGTLTVENVPIVPGVITINRAALTLDTVKHIVSASAEISLPPGLTVSGNLEFIGGRLNLLKLGVDGLNIPIDATGAILTGISGGVGNIVTGPPSILVGVRATAGPQVTLNLPSWAGGGGSAALLTLKADAQFDRDHFALVGSAVLISESIGTGTVKVNLNWTKGTILVEGNVSLLKGLVEGNVLFRGDRNLNLTAYAAARIRIPDIKQIPRFLRGRELAGGGFLFDYSNNGISADDVVAGWVTIRFIKKITLGVKVSFDGNWQLIGAAPAPPRQLSIQAAAEPAALTTSASQTFTVAASRPWLVLTAGWETPTPGVAFEIIKPDGTVLTEEQVRAHAKMKIVDEPELSGDTTRTIAIADPEAGDWTIRLLDAALLGEVEFDALQGDAEPSIRITGLTQDASTGRVTVSYDARDPDSNAKVALYYDDNRAGNDGMIIVRDLPESDGPGTFDWDPVVAGVASGDYAVYAMIADDVNPPVFSEYAPGVVRVVDPAGPPKVQNLQVQRLGLNRIDLGWDPVADADFYVLTATDPSAPDMTPMTMTTEDSTGKATFAGLTAGATYHLSVQAVHSAEDMFHLGEAATPVVATVPDPATAPDLIVSKTGKLPDSAVGGSTGKLKWTVRNLGPGRLNAPVAFSVYLSADSILDADDVPVASAQPTLKLKANRSRSLSTPFTYPMDLAEGAHYVLVKADAADEIIERNEDNNVYATTTTVLMQRPFVDLQPTFISAPVRAAPGATVRVSTTIRNNGNVPFIGAVPMAIVIVSDGANDGPRVVTTVEPRLSLTSGKRRPARFKVTLPTDLAAGAYRLGAEVDPADVIEEGAEDNNAAISVTWNMK